MEKKYEWLDENIQANEIGVCLEGMRSVMLLTYKELADRLEMNETVVSMLLTKKDEEISADILQKIFKFADEVKSSKSKESSTDESEFILTCAERISNATRKELDYKFEI